MTWIDRVEIFRTRGWRTGSGLMRFRRDEHAGTPLPPRPVPPGRLRTPRARGGLVIADRLGRKSLRAVPGTSVPAAELGCAVPLRVRVEHRDVGEFVGEVERLAIEAGSERIR